MLGEDLVVRKFKLLDGAVDQLESTERDDLRAELDARFALMAGEVKRLFNVLEKALKSQQGRRLSLAWNVRRANRVRRHRHTLPARALQSPRPSTIARTT